MAETAATLSLAIKLSDQLTAELKKVADTTRRETDRAARSVAGFGDGFAVVGQRLKSLARTARDILGGFGIGTAFGFGVTGLANYFGELTREIQASDRALEAFTRRRSFTGATSLGTITQEIKAKISEVRTVYDIARSDLAGLAGIGRGVGINDQQIVDSIKLAAELSQAYGVDLASAMDAVSQATIGTADGYEKLGQALGILIKDSADAERALLRLRLEAERSALDAKSGFLGGEFSNPNSASRKRQNEIAQQLAQIGRFSPQPSIVDTNNRALSQRTFDVVRRLEDQESALRAAREGATLQDKLAAIQRDLDGAVSDLDRGVAQLIKDIERSKLPNRDTLRGQVIDARDSVFDQLQRAALQKGEQERTANANRGLQRAAADAETELRQRQAFERDPKFAGRGADRALTDIKAEYNDLNQRAYESTRRLAQGLEDNFADAFQSVLDGSEDLGAAVNNLFRGLVSDLTQEAARQVSKSLVGLIFGAGDRGMTTDGAGFSGSSLMSSARFLSAYSNAPMRALADGGVLYRPTLAVAGENGPEAFVPLRGGKIPVSVNGAGGSTVVNLTLNVSSWDGQDAARSVQKAMPQIVAGVQKAIATDRSMRSAIKSA